jgi:hypothetical protein
MSAAAAVCAVAADPLSVFVRAISVMGFPRTGTPECDSAAALRAHEVALAMDPNAILHLWLSGIRLREFGRFDEALAIRAELTERARSEYIGPVAFLTMLDLDLGDDDATATLLRSNVEAESGPVGIYLTVARELELLLTHPRLGPLVRQLSLYVQRPGLPPMPR